MTEAPLLRATRSERSSGGTRSVMQGSACSPVQGRGYVRLREAACPCRPISPFSWLTGTHCLRFPSQRTYPEVKCHDPMSALLSYLPHVPGALVARGASAASAPASTTF